MFLPKLIGAIIVFIIGWFISVGIGKLVAEILKRLRFNSIFERGCWKEALEKAELKVDPSGFVGAIVKWVLVIVFLLAAVEILGMVQFAGLVGYGKLVGSIVKWAIWIFAILAILMQLKIAVELILTLFTGFVVMVAIAGGIAFGLGGKEMAGEILQTLRDKLRS